MASQQSPYLSEARWAYLANMGSRGRTHKSEVGMNIWNRGPTLTLCRLSEHDVRSWCASSVLDPLLETAWPQNLKSNSKHCKMCFSMCIIWISGYLQLPQQSIDCCVHIYPFMFTCNKDLKKGWLWASAKSPTSFTQYVCSQCASSYEDRWPTLSWHRQRNLKFSSRPRVLCRRPCSRSRLGSADFRKIPGYPLLSFATKSCKVSSSMWEKLTCNYLQSWEREIEQKRQNWYFVARSDCWASGSDQVLQTTSS